MQVGFGMKGRIWITNGKLTKHIPADQQVPKGFYRGRNGFRPQPQKPFIPSLHPLYSMWQGMMARCYNAQAAQYRDYGGRGIQVTFRWRRSFVCFAYDVEKEIGKRPEGRTSTSKRTKYVFDRIRNDEGYKPGNIKWSTYSESNCNRRQSKFTIGFYGS